MDILKQLLQNELLNEATKTQIQESFNAMRQQIVESETARIEQEVTVKLTEQFIAERDMLVEALDSKMGTVLEAELAELRDSINEFRDLEVEYSQRLVEAEKQLGEQLNKDLVALVHVVESFLEEMLTTELTELKESIDEARTNMLGRKIVEAFSDEFVALANPSNKLASQLRAVQEQNAELEQKLQQVVGKLEVVSESNQQFARKAKLGELLNQLTGSKREVMESLLKDVPTDLLSEKFNLYVPRLIESAVDDGNKGSIITESANVTEGDLKVVTGDTPNLVESAEHRTNSGLSTDEIATLKRLAGI